MKELHVIDVARQVRQKLQFEYAENIRSVEFKIHVKQQMWFCKICCYQ